ncbi:family 16 glycosylhydrolase [Roseomonas sp. NAR14]|uniref:Family 16 glycosylhydrolase n=1 Tax=Roseomonas acroporae TaxID=2937791 RepID=A0A9X1Y3J6_9PROT|nr:family 16 glycosylhydrolase [Roseomonas acroporae]MCK8783309.1 family 16 glycosylhydrolase [Roseomonas acroporae]
MAYYSYAPNTIDYRGLALPLSNNPTIHIGASGAWETLRATGGANGLWSLGGANTLIGGATDTTFYVTAANDTVIAQPGYVNTIVSWYTSQAILPDNVQNLIVKGGTIWSGGNALANIIRGDGAGQVIAGGAGDDVLTGGGGSDVFVFAAGDGNDVVTDFVHGSSIVRLDNVPGFTTFSQVRAAMAQVGADVRLALGSDQSILFRNQTLADFTAADFRLPIDPSKLVMTFDDEFDSFSWSASGKGTTWRTQWDYGRTLSDNNEQEYYSDASVGFDPFSVRDGVLTITGQPGSNALGLPYVSGMINSQKSFAQTYGYFEMRAELPAGKGLWPAFWLLPQDGSWPPEIDIFEMIGTDPSTLYFSAGTKTGTGTSVAAHTPDTSDGFHTFGVLWAPDDLTYYVDGNVVAQIATPADMHKAMYIVVNLAIGGNWPGSPDGTTEFPAEMNIDYIRAYAYQGATALPDSVAAQASRTAKVYAESAAASGAAFAARAAKAGALGLDSIDDAAQITVKLAAAQGVLHTTPAAGGGVAEAGEGTGSLVLAGTKAAVEAELASLTYAWRGHAVLPTVGATDSIVMTVDDGHGGVISDTAAVTVGAATTRSFTFGSTPVRKAGTGDTLFVFDGVIADPKYFFGIADHIINFRTADTNGGSGDVLAFHGFGADATLQFHHLAAPGGVVNPSMQYYTVHTAAGDSPIFLIQMANGSPAHLGTGDYVFY